MPRNCAVRDTPRAKFLHRVRVKWYRVLWYHRSPLARAEREPRKNAARGDSEWQAENAAINNSNKFNAFAFSGLDIAFLSPLAAAFFSPLSRLIRFPPFFFSHRRHFDCAIFKGTQSRLRLRELIKRRIFRSALN